jgi:hypothetical protein
MPANRRQANRKREDRKQEDQCSASARRKLECDGPDHPGPLWKHAVALAINWADSTLAAGLLFRWRRCRVWTLFCAMRSVRTFLVILIVLLTAAALAEQGQDRSDSKCERTNKTDTKMGGSCGFVCKDLVITIATGEAKASGFQYVCSRRTTTPSAVRERDTPIRR